jgi:phosphinothricin acetyltransferase
MIRTVKQTDIEQIAKLYNYYIENTTVVFAKKSLSSDEVQQRIEEICRKNFPYIVYEENGKLLGFACLNTFRPHSAYDITLEASIYIDRNEKGKGIGSMLFAELIKHAKQMKTIHSLVSVVALPNDESRRLHEKFGFRLVGNFKESGQKFGKLIDVEFWQLML